MNLQLIYFSPTATTKKIVTAIASGFPAQQLNYYDLTRVEQPAPIVFNDGLAIIGIPVYAGRVPEVCLQRLAGFSATGRPAVLVALYGNREYEDALIELRAVATAAGFQVVAAGAFIGEHSYSTAEQPIAAGRPDPADLQVAADFGRQLVAKLSTDNGLQVPQLPGDLPYRDRVPLGGIAPITDPATCTLCGICAEVCPTFVVEVTEQVTTRAENCLMCCACVKQCPPRARKMVHPAIQQRREMLLNNCQRRKAPELFL